MTNLPYVAFYPSKWLARTAKLSAVERGIFITLICEMYECMEPLKVDEKRLAMLCGTTKATFKKTLAMLLEDEQKICLVDGRIWNHRVEKEIENAKNKSEKNSKNSRVRWEKDNKNKGRSKRSLSQPPSIPEPYPEDNLPSENADSSEPIRIDPRDQFLSGDCLFDESRWFSENEIAFLEDKHPKINVRAKLAEPSFRAWAFEQERQNPVLPARRWFEKQARIEEAEASLIQTYTEAKNTDYGDMSHLQAALDRKGRH